MNKVLRFALWCTAVLLTSCAGTISVHEPVKPIGHVKKIHILKRGYSSRIPNQFVPLGIITIQLDEPVHPTTEIGGTFQYIYNYLAQNGYKVTSGSIEDMPKGVDGILVYEDYWRWDIKDYLYYLEIVLFDGSGNEVLAGAKYQAYPGETHDYPTAEREVPNVLNALFQNI